jgi:hypothetical protein
MPTTTLSDRRSSTTQRRLRTVAAAIAVPALIFGLAACSSDSSNEFPLPEGQPETDNNTGDPDAPNTDTETDTDDYCALVTAYDAIGQGALPEAAAAARELAAAAPDAAAAEAWNTAAGFFDAAQTVNIEDLSTATQLFEEWRIDEIQDQIRAHTDDLCGPTGDTSAGPGDDTSPNADPAEPATTSEYCVLAHEFGYNVTDTVAFSNRPHAMAISQAFREIADAAPDATVADDWNALADAVEELSDSAVDPGEFNFTLTELNHNLPERHQGVNAVPSRLAQHLHNECDFSAMPAREDNDRGVEPASEYCNVVEQFNYDFTAHPEVPVPWTREMGMPYATFVADELRAAGNAAADGAIAADWNTLADAIESLGDGHVDSIPMTFRNYQDDPQFGPLIDRLYAHMYNECG